MSTVDALLSRLYGVKPSGSHKWMASCPSHDDRSPSLSIREADDGAVLLHCFAGCAAPEVLATIGLELADLYPQTNRHRRDPKARNPRMNGWDAVRALQFRLTVISLCVERVSKGERLREVDLAQFLDACAELQRLLGEATRANG